MTTQQQSTEDVGSSLLEESAANVHTAAQRSYRPTPYEPEVWPVVSQATREDSFQVLSYERVSESQYAVDPMFANFDAEVAARGSGRTGMEGRHSHTAALEQLGAYQISGHDSGEPQEGDFDIVEPGTAEHLYHAATSIGGASLEDSATQHAPDVAASEGVDSSRKPSKRPAHKAGDSADIEERVEREVQVRLAAAQEEREQMLAQVQESAYAKALEDTKKEYAGRFETIVEDVRTQASEHCRDNEQQAVELAFQIAKKLLGSVVTDHREYINDVISEALRAAANTEIKCVRVSPQDYEFLVGSQAADAAVAQERAWKLESDDSVGAGCIVTTTAGDIDFDLERSWARMREKVSRGPKL